jgi:integrase
MRHSTKGKQSRKAANSFPLFKHATGRWTKKIKGRFHYFGKVADDPTGQAALNLWLEQRDDLIAGRKPRGPQGEGVTIADLCNHYLCFLDDQVKRGSRSKRWHEDVQRTLKMMLDATGRNWAADSLTQQDFADIASRFRRTRNKKHPSPITVKNHILRVRGMFNWAKKAEYIKQLPAYGVAFTPPDRSEVDRHRDKQVPRYFDRHQVRSLLRATKDKPRIHAAILLAINTGCQNEDIATLQLKHLDLKGGWYLQPRSKKAKERKAKLWRRTVRALKAVLQDREVSEDDLVFISKLGGAWDGRNCLAKEFARVKKVAGITARGAGFQWLRHSFITEASQGGDVLAVQLACGHAERSVTQNYIRHIYDERLVKIADLVENWLIGKGGQR